MSSPCSLRAASGSFCGEQVTLGPVWLARQLVCSLRLLPSCKVLESVGTAKFGLARTGDCSVPVTVPCACCRSRPGGMQVQWDGCPPSMIAGNGACGGTLAHPLWQRQSWERLQDAGSANDTNQRCQRVGQAVFPHVTRRSRVLCLHGRSHASTTADCMSLHNLYLTVVCEEGNVLFEEGDTEKADTSRINSFSRISLAVLLVYGL